MKRRSLSVFEEAMMVFIKVARNFLDIACALIGERKDLAIQVWKSLGWSPELGICSLIIEKALIMVDEMDCLKMHDHLRTWGEKL